MSSAVPPSEATNEATDVNALPKDQDDEYLNVSFESGPLDPEEKAAHEADTLPMASEKVEEDKIEDDSSCWMRAKQTVNDCLKPVLRSQASPLTSDSSLRDRIKYAVLCPPHGFVAKLITLIIMILCASFSAYCVFGSVAAPPNGSIFWIIVVVIFAFILGDIVAYVKLPPLLGMLLAGIIIKNCGVKFDDHWKGISSTLRSAALMIILMRAGLGLDPEALKKLSGMVFRLAFSPCLMEATTVAITSHLILGLPWLWGFMMGFVLAAVSPAVVVPCLLRIQERGYGVDKGIPTLVIAAASVDDVLAISCFTILLGIVFKPGGDLASEILQGPKEAFIGLAFGIFWGILSTFFPSNEANNLGAKRTIVLTIGGILGIFGSNRLKISGAGALSVLVSSFVAGVGWRSRGWDVQDKVSKNLSAMWFIFQPILFALIGTEIRVGDLDPEFVGWGILVLAIGLTVRILTTCLVVMGGNLNSRERFFTALAWLPKATVQAAIGPVALDQAAKLSSSDERYDEFNKRGLMILTLAVLSILITAPIGSAAIMLSHPYLLKKSDKKDDDATDIDGNV